MAVRIIATGGTFDKQYNPVEGVLGFDKSHIPQMLAQGRVCSPFVFESLRLLDSLDMTDTDRKQILQACVSSLENKILIVHGTDTMHKTAAVLAESLLKKTIVLTGAMIPNQIAGSDAFFNLGFAFAAVQLLKSGVYIAMNGKVFTWDNVKKNRALGIFEMEKRF